MAIVQINIPETLWERLQQTGRPIEEVVVETLEKAFDDDLATSSGVGSRDKVVRKLMESGTLIDPIVWDDTYARAWLDLPEDERERLIEEMNRERHPGALASRAVIEGRR